jgi:hypothetical protein
VDLLAIESYQRYIDYLEDVIIYNLKHAGVDTGSAPPDPPSSGDD